MSTFTVVVTRDLSGPLRDELREREVPCVVIETGPGAPPELVRACSALAGAGLSSVLQTDATRVAELARSLRPALTRVLAAGPSIAATILELEDAGWVPGLDDVYSPQELDVVTARLQDLGYA